MPETTITSFGDFCAAVELLHVKNHHRLKIQCALFLSGCYREAYKSFKNPNTYYGAEPESSDCELDDFNSELVVEADDVMQAFMDDDEYASELEEIQNSPANSSLINPND